MKVVKKFQKSRVKKLHPRRPAIALPMETFDVIDKLRGNSRRSEFVANLIEREKRRIEREAFIAAANSACTPEVIAETLRVHAEFPIHGAA